ncbi:fructose-6-phosphate aldolase [Anaeromicrobium sediminis]|uniref:Fructose-6-phosphate aldolase n=1 Tax=Anaeromicrobium sediminis TaxID=1478221 RepID=A0A267MLD5_9FIRM|nr:fructose-6-phosphate aldolase [Anaeromicrobium sediminis]PAB60222.1 fructose-6-phosphate aldolase [Anaeromicrobium sediminis]
MKYILDTANVEIIKYAKEYFPIEGITTNPTIISRENRNFLDLMGEIRAVIGEDIPIHIQVVSNNAQEIAEEGNAIVKKFGKNIYVKIPVTREGIKAIKILKSENIKVTATAIYTSQQALIAAKAGADYVAPYVNRIDNLSSNGCNVVGNIIRQLKAYDLKTKVIAASFKNVQQVDNVANMGVHAVTVSPEIFEKLHMHLFTDASVEQFIKDWKKVYGDKNIRDMI